MRKAASNENPPSSEAADADPEMSKPGKKGFSRLIAATGYSIKGLKSAWENEEAFRLELCLCLLFLPFSFVVAETLSHQLFLIGTCFLVVIVELINSAIEAIVDRVSVERHPLSGQAKDIGSAAVMTAVILFLVSWGLSLWQLIFSS